MLPISRLETPGEVYRNQPVRRLRRADVVDDGRRVGGHDRAAAVRRPIWFVALRLAPFTVRVFGLHDRTLDDGSRDRSALMAHVGSRNQIEA